MLVLTVGASGPHAGLVVPELIERGVTVRALVRDDAGAARARTRGVQETVLGDLLDPASLRAAAEGVDGVFHLNPAFAPDEAGMGTAMVEAAGAAGVRTFVFSSVYHPSMSLINHAAKRPVEEALYASGMRFTVLQPAMFMQMLGGAVEQARRTGRITGPYSARSKMTYVDYRDVAEAAALALTGDELTNGTFELAAPGMVDRGELAALISTAIGRPVDAGETSAEEFTARVPAGPLRDGLTAMNAEYDRHGFPGGNALVLRAILGREPRTLTDFIAEHTHREPR